MLKNMLRFNFSLEYITESESLIKFQIKLVNRKNNQKIASNVNVQVRD